GALTKTNLTRAISLLDSMHMGYSSLATPGLARVGQIHRGNRSSGRRDGGQRGTPVSCPYSAWQEVSSIGSLSTGLAGVSARSLAGLSRMSIFSCMFLTYSV